MIVCAMALMATLVQVGVASGVIYQLYSLQYFDHGPTTKPLNNIFDMFKDFNLENGPYQQKEVSTGDLSDKFLGLVNKIGGNVVSNTAKYGTVRVCYGLFSIEDYYGI